MTFALALAALLWPHAAASAGLLCDTGGTQAPPRIVVKAGDGHRLFLCSVKAKKRKGKVDVSGFRVFEIGRSGRKHNKPVFQSELDTKTFRAEAAGQELRLAELVWDGKAKVPGFETVVACDAQGCRASKPAKCVFVKPKAGSRRALEQVAEYQHGKLQGKAPPKTLIDSLASLAYSGDEDAQELFRDRGPLALDGEAADLYFEHQANLDRLRKASCL